MRAGLVSFNVEMVFLGNVEDLIEDRILRCLNLQ